ncbi:MAG: hypothetical protein SPF92_06925 [Clostridia bacterium]|nr:hypothetical protein [Clostridia bacterium]
MKNKVAFVLLLSMCLMLFAGCNNELKTLYQSESVEVVREGNKTAVYDLLADKEYNYITKRVKRSEGVLEPYTTVDTDTIKIEIIPSGLRVYDKAKNKIFTIERKIK